MFILFYCLLPVLLHCGQRPPPLSPGAATACQGGRIPWFFSWALGHLSFVDVAFPPYPNPAFCSLDPPDWGRVKGQFGRITGFILREAQLRWGCVMGSLSEIH